MEQTKIFIALLIAFVGTAFLGRDSETKDYDYWYAGRIFLALFACGLIFFYFFDQHPENRMLKNMYAGEPDF